MNIKDLIVSIGKKAKEASYKLSTIETKIKNAALKNAGDLIINSSIVLLSMVMLWKGAEFLVDSASQILKM